MNIIFVLIAIILLTIVLAIFSNRLVRCPLLVGFIFFSIALLVAMITANMTIVILAIIAGIVAFLSALLDCVFKSSRFLRENACMTCHNPYDCDRGRERESNNNNNNNCNCNDETLRIVNGDGEIVARINGNSIDCIDNNDSGCCSREYRRM